MNYPRGRRGGENIVPSDIRTPTVTSRYIELGPLREATINTKGKNSSLTVSVLRGRRSYISEATGVDHCSESAGALRPAGLARMPGSRVGGLPGVRGVSQGQGRPIVRAHQQRRAV